MCDVECPYTGYCSSYNKRCCLCANNTKAKRDYFRDTSYPWWYNGNNCYITTSITTCSDDVHTDKFVPKS